MVVTTTKAAIRIASVAFALACAAVAGDVQQAARLPGGIPARIAAPPPPRDVPLEVKALEDLPPTPMGPDLARALAVKPDRWFHAETANFILHFRRATEARKVAVQLEWHLWYVASFFGADKARYERKSRVAIFEDEGEWAVFVSEVPGIEWAQSFARGDELYLSVRGAGGRGFDETTLAHEATHAVTARIFQGQRWPLWLREGVAEYLGHASVAGRKGQTPGRDPAIARFGALPPEKLEAILDYPADADMRAMLYASAYRLVRFMATEFPADRLARWIEACAGGKAFADALQEIYGDQIRSRADFDRRWARFRG